MKLRRRKSGRKKTLEQEIHQKKTRQEFFINGKQRNIISKGFFCFIDGIIFSASNLRLKIQEIV